MKKILSTMHKVILFSVALLTFGSLFETAYAAPAPSTATGPGQALELGPPVVNLKADPGQSVKAQINLRDVSNSKLIVTNEINDFTANGEDGTPKLLLNNSSSAAYSIKSWISPLPQFTLVPKQIQTLDVNVKIPSNASPGGYYGVIRFTGTPPGLNSSGVALSASIGALVFIRVNGQAKESLTVQEFSVNNGGQASWLFESGPVNFAERIQNNGNLFEQPTGTVDVKDMFGKDMGSQTINASKGTILQGTIRRFSQPFDQTVYGNKWLFGKYTATMQMTYGDSAQTLTSTLTFWVIPYKLIAAIIIALIALFFLLRFALHAYVNRVVGQSGRRGGRRR